MKRTSLLLLAIFLAALPALSQVEETVTATWSGPAAIPDDDADTPILLPVFVNRGLDISDVEVTLTLSHSDLSDLEVDLIDPAGRTRRLMDEDCGGLFRDEVELVFDMGAGAEFGDACPPATFAFRPDEDIDDWDDDNSFGRWDVRVEDVDDNGTGVVVDYHLRITGIRFPEPTLSFDAVRDAASYRLTAITPGELLWVSGVNVGPQQATYATPDPADGTFPTELEGTEVTFDGIEAPITYAASSLLQVQVPWELADRSQTLIRVAVPEATSAPVALNVVSASPGIYTLEGQGTGRAKIVNADGSLNLPENAAARGSFIALYANGLGPVSSDVATGEVTPPTAVIDADAEVRVFIGGVEADVAFAGLAPGFFGAYQLNIRVPETAPTGQRIPIVITANGLPSQDEVFLAIE